MKNIGTDALPSPLSNSGNINCASIYNSLLVTLSGSILSGIWKSDLSIILSLYFSPNSFISALNKAVLPLLLRPINPVKLLISIHVGSFPKHL